MTSIGDKTFIRFLSHSNRNNSIIYKTISGYDRQNRSGISIRHSSNVTVKECILTDWGGEGNWWNPVYGEWSDYSGSYTSGGIYLYNTDGTYIMYNEIHGGSNGICLRNSDVNYVWNNDIYDSDWAGIGTGAGSQINEIKWNYVEGANVGISPCISGMGNTIWDNDVIDSLWIGICLCSNADYNHLDWNTIYSTNTDPPPQVLATDIHLMGSAGDNNDGDDNSCFDTIDWNDYEDNGCTSVPPK